MLIHYNCNDTYLKTDFWLNCANFAKLKFCFWKVCLYGYVRTWTTKIQKYYFFYGFRDLRNSYDDFSHWPKMYYVKSGIFGTTKTFTDTESNHFFDFRGEGLSTVPYGRSTPFFCNATCNIIITSTCFTCSTYEMIMYCITGKINKT